MLRVTSLASGSSGNAFLVETDQGPLLVEAGLSAWKLERLLQQRHVDPRTLQAIVLSHEHHDHAQGAGPLARRWHIPVVCSARTAQALAAELAHVDILALDGVGVQLGAIELTGFALPHDAVDPQGIVLDYQQSRVGWALDLGHVPAHVPPILATVDLAIIEANHDRERLLSSRYPRSTKYRILSEQGHLSNLQAAELLAAIAAGGRCRTAWLAHLSAHTNDHPQAVLRHIQAYLAMAGCPALKLGIAERDQPSATWEAAVWVQHGLLD